MKKLRTNGTQIVPDVRSFCYLFRFMPSPIVVMMLAFGATAFAAQEPRTMVSCCTNCGDGLYFPDDDPHDDHDNVEPSPPGDPCDYHHNGDGGLYFPV